MSQPTSLKLDPATTGILIIDVQERLASAMPEDALHLVERRSAELAKLAELKSLPVLVTEQYPKGLGPTVGPIAEALAPLSVTPIEKVSFDCAGEPRFTDALEAQVEADRRTWVVAGMETHVCVFQTVRSLVDRGLSVHVPQDAVSSRRESERVRGLELINRVGAVVTTTETAIFDLLGKAGGPEFKEMSRRLREL